MESIAADTILESSDNKFNNHSARKTVVNKLIEELSERLPVGDCKGHWTPEHY